MEQQEIEERGEVLFVYDLVGNDAVEDEWQDWDDILDNDGVSPAEHGFMQGWSEKDSESEYFV